jgi:hypothetical protein
MKKYLIASVVAMMAFSFAAFAASLNVTAPTLQVGQTADGALECADNAEIVAWMYNDLNGSVDGARVRLSTDDVDTDHTCDGDRLYVTPLNQAGTILANIGGGAYSTGSILVDDANYHAGTDSYLVIFGTTTAYTGHNASVHPVDGGSLYGARVGIDQG